MYYTPRLSAPPENSRPVQIEERVQQGARVRCTAAHDLRFGKTGRVAQVIDSDSVLVRWEDDQGSSLSRISADRIKGVDAKE